MSTTPQTDKMTLPPIIVTAHAAPGDMAYFDQMRRKHFPPHRNFLNAHITLFHHLPGRVFGEASSLAQEVVAQTQPFTRKFLASGIWAVASPSRSGALNWKPCAPTFSKPLARGPAAGSTEVQTAYHCPEQGGEGVRGYSLRALRAGLEPRHITILGIDLWDYLGGPWGHRAFLPFPQ